MCVKSGSQKKCMSFSLNHLTSFKCFMKVGPNLCNSKRCNNTRALHVARAGEMYPHTISHQCLMPDRSFICGDEDGTLDPQIKSLFKKYRYAGFRKMLLGRVQQHLLI